MGEGGVQYYDRGPVALAFHRLHQFLVDSALPAGTVFLEGADHFGVEPQRHLHFRMFEFRSAALLGPEVFYGLHDGAMHFRKVAQRTRLAEHFLRPFRIVRIVDRLAAIFAKVVFFLFHNAAPLCDVPFEN